MINVYSQIDMCHPRLAVPLLSHTFTFCTRLLSKLSLFSCQCFRLMPVFTLFCHFRLPCCKVSNLCFSSPLFATGTHYSLLWTCLAAEAHRSTNRWFGQHKNRLPSNNCC